MNEQLKILYFFTDLILPLIVGYYIKKKGWLNEPFMDQSIRAGIWLLFPLLTILSFWVLELNMNLIWLPFLGIIMNIIPGAAGYLRSRQKYQDPLEKGAYIISNMLSNRATVGSLSVYIIFGETGFAYCRLTILFSTVIVFMFCYPLARYFSRKNQGKGAAKLSLASVLFNWNQLPVIGIILGLLLNLTNTPRPDFLSTLFDIMVHVVPWFCVIPIGYGLNFQKLGNYWKDIYDYALIKFIITPTLVYIIAKLIYKDSEIVATLVILSMAPTAMNAVIAVRANKLNIHLASAAFISTTAFYILLIFPIMLVLWSVVFV